MENYSEEEPYNPDNILGSDDDDESSRGPGRPPFEPTAQQRQDVLTAARWGVPHEMIAKRHDISAKTLRKHFREELDFGAYDANNTVMGSLFEMAGTKHNVSAAIFWAKTRCGLRPGGAPYDNAPGVTPPVAKDSQYPTGFKPIEFDVYCNDGEPNFDV